MTTTHALEVKSGDRFRFGENWARFLRNLDGRRVAEAEESLRSMLDVRDLRGRRFLDIGSGSGLFSLAARRLGAEVRSFDYDPQSVACTEELRSREFPADPQWRVEQGSVLDDTFMDGLGTFDVVYSWGVLHHTGDMRRAFANAASRVAPGGTLFIAIYNDQGWISRYWTTVKRLYNRSVLLRLLMIVIHVPWLLVARWIARAITGRRRLERGMSLWRDMIDWLGGYPFEVARPEEVFRVFRDAGFDLEELKTCGGRMGCNEFVLRRRA